MKLFGPLLRAILWLLAAALLAVARLHPAIHHWLLVLSSGLTADRLRAYVAGWGALAPAASVVLMVVLTFLPFPADPLIIANGAVFGVWEGLLVSVAGAVFSGAVAFSLGRVLGRRFARRIVPARFIEWVDAMAGEGTWAAVLFVQFVPAVPFSVLNFLLGATGLSWGTFLWTLVASILPSDVVLVLLGRGLAEGNSAVYWTVAALAVLVIGSFSLRRRFAQTWHSPAAEHAPE